MLLTFPNLPHCFCHVQSPDLRDSPPSATELLTEDPCCLTTSREPSIPLRSLSATAHSAGIRSEQHWRGLSLNRASCLTSAFRTTVTAPRIIFRSLILTRPASSVAGKRWRK